MHSSFRPAKLPNITNEILQHGHYFVAISRAEGRVLPLPSLITIPEDTKGIVTSRVASRVPANVNQPSPYTVSSFAALRITCSHSRYSLIILEVLYPPHLYYHVLITEGVVVGHPLSR